MRSKPLWIVSPFLVIRSRREDKVIILSQHDRSDTVLLQFVCNGPAGFGLATARFPCDRDRVSCALPDDCINDLWNNLTCRSSVAFLEHKDIAFHDDLPIPALAGLFPERRRVWSPCPLPRRGNCLAPATVALRSFVPPPSMARSGEELLLSIGQLKPEIGVRFKFQFRCQGDDGG